MKYIACWWGRDP